MSRTSSTSVSIEPKLLNDRAIVKDPTGFTNNQNITVTYDTTNRTITLTGTFAAYYQGTLVTVLTNGWVSAAHSAGVTVPQFLSYDGVNFNWASSYPGIENLLIAIVIFKSDGTFLFCQREVHGFMPHDAHEDFHNNVGTYKNSGGTLSSYVTGSATSTNRRPQIVQTVISDEDLRTTLAALSTNSYSIFNLTSTSTPNIVTGQTEFVKLSGNQPYYNSFSGTWGQTLMSNLNYMTMWLIGIPASADSDSQAMRYVWVQGQSQSLSLATQQSLTPGDVNLGDLANLLPELVFLNKVIIQYIAANWVITQVDILSGSRFIQTSSSGGDFLSTVVTDSTLTGSGSASDPLMLTDTTTGYLINSLTAKTTPADNDGFAMMDSAAANVAKKVLWGNFKTSLSAIFASLTGTQTLTNKRITPRVFSAASATTLTPEKSTYDKFVLTSLTTSLNIANYSTSTPTDGETILIQITSAAAQNLTYGTKYVEKAGQLLPITTVAGKTTTMLFGFIGATSEYNLLAVGQQL